MKPVYVSLNYYDAMYFNLVDKCDKEHKYFRFEDTTISVEVSIEDTKSRTPEGVEIMRVSLTTEIDDGIERIYKTNFTWASPFGCKLNQILCDDNDKDTEDEEEEKEEEKEEEEKVVTGAMLKAKVKEFIKFIEDKEINGTFTTKDIELMEEVYGLAKSINDNKE
jgi:hypothetical protein